MMPSYPDRSHQILLAPWPQSQGPDLFGVCDALLAPRASDYRRVADIAARLPPNNKDRIQWHDALARYQTSVEGVVADLVRARLRDDGWAHVELLHDPCDASVTEGWTVSTYEEAYPDDAVYRDAWAQVDAAAVPGADEVHDATSCVLAWAGELLWKERPPATWPHTPEISAAHCDQIGQAFGDARDELHPTDLLRTLARIEEAVESNRACAVYDLRAAGWSWASIADALLSDPETTWRRYEQFDRMS